MVYLLLWLRRAQRDALGEAKASGNLGNTLKMLGRFDEATLFCERHLLISRREGDKVNIMSNRYRIPDTNPVTNLDVWGTF